MQLQIGSCIKAPGALKGEVVVVRTVTGDNWTGTRFAGVGTQGTLTSGNIADLREPTKGHVDWQFRRKRGNQA